MEVNNDDEKPDRVANDSANGEGGEGSGAEHSENMLNGDVHDQPRNRQEHQQQKHAPPSGTSTTTANRPTGTTIVNPYAKINSNKSLSTAGQRSQQNCASINVAAGSVSSSLKSSCNVNAMAQKGIQPRTPPINPYAKVKKTDSKSQNNDQPSDKQKLSTSDVDGPYEKPLADNRGECGGAAASKKSSSDLQNDAVYAGSAAVSSSATGITTTATTQQQTWTPYWDRLPSKTLQSPCPPVTETTADDTSSALPSATTTTTNASIPNQNTQAPAGSFGSAEVLTVAECIEHAELYKNRPVRVTGVLHHRSFLAVTTASPSSGNDLPGGAGNHLGQKDLIVQLELKDPVMELLALNNDNHNRNSGFERPKASSSRPKSIPAASRGTNSLSTSSTIRTSGGLKTPSIQKTRKRRMPWFQNPSKDGRRRTSLGTSGVGNIGRNSLSTTATTIRSSNGLVGKNATKSTTMKNAVLKVLVDPQLPQLDTVVVGSVVMVIGTIIETSSSQQQTNTETSIGKGITCTVDDKEDKEINDKIDPTSPKRIDNEREEGEETLNDLTSPVKPSQNRYVYKLDARLVQVMPKGSDLTLYRTALERRRKTLWKRYHMSQNSTDKVLDRTSKVLLQGCGPPPYDRWVDKA